jgi:sugar phosphate isomerase/epimerase
MEDANFGIATGAFLAERDDWAASLARAVSEGWLFLELTAIEEPRLQTLMPILRDQAATLRSFRRISIHAPVRLRTSASEAAPMIEAAAADFDVVFHPDVYGDEDWLRRLRSRVVFENMDASKAFGQTVADLSPVFDRFGDAGFCLDVAHVWTIDPTLALAHELLDNFGHRLRQLHVSGIEPDGTHRSTTATDLDLYRPVLKRCAHVPWLLEAELERGAATAERASKSHPGWRAESGQHSTGIGPEFAATMQDSA